MSEGHKNSDWGDWIDKHTRTLIDEESEIDISDLPPTILKRGHNKEIQDALIVLSKNELSWDGFLLLPTVGQLLVSIHINRLYPRFKNIEGFIEHLIDNEIDDPKFPNYRWCLLCDEKIKPTQRTVGKTEISCLCESCFNDGVIIANIIYRIHNMSFDTDRVVPDAICDFYKRIIFEWERIYINPVNGDDIDVSNEPFEPLGINAAEDFGNLAETREWDAFLDTDSGQMCVQDPLTRFEEKFPEFKELKLDIIVGDAYDPDVDVDISAVPVGGNQLVKIEKIINIIDRVHNMSMRVVGEHNPDFTNFMQRISYEWRVLISDEEEATEETEEIVAVNTNQMIEVFSEEEEEDDGGMMVMELESDDAEDDNNSDSVGRGLWGAIRQIKHDGMSAFISQTGQQKFYDIVFEDVIAYLKQSGYSGSNKIALENGIEFIDTCLLAEVKIQEIQSLVHSKCFMCNITRTCGHKFGNECYLGTKCVYVAIAIFKYCRKLRETAGRYDDMDDEKLQLVQQELDQNLLELGEAVKNKVRYHEEEHQDDAVIIPVSHSSFFSIYNHDSNSSSQPFDLTDYSSPVAEKVEVVFDPLSAIPKHPVEKEKEEEFADYDALSSPPPISKRKRDDIVEKEKEEEEESDDS